MTSAADVSSQAVSPALISGAVDIGAVTPSRNRDIKMGRLAWWRGGTQQRGCEGARTTLAAPRSRLRVVANERYDAVCGLVSGCATSPCASSVAGSTIHANTRAKKLAIAMSVRARSMSFSVRLGPRKVLRHGLRSFGVGDCASCTKRGADEGGPLDPLMVRQAHHERMDWRRAVAP